ncbi:CGNR zinc finger domain-containing protein [Sphaerimonospora cavernae]|uniref:CGNR zinc finger domain-containing protein n=1 Tax=Sphaerimonospora cavernae TaxID=1740611 RepID=A0ABV6UBB8_9ACTN
MASHTEPTTSAEGVPPVRGEPLALEFANTLYAEHGVLREGIGSPGELRRWLEACRDRFAVALDGDCLEHIKGADVRFFTLLRDAVRGLLQAYVDGSIPSPWDVAQLNRASSMNCLWMLLEWAPGDRPTALVAGVASPLLGVQAELAQSAIKLLTGDTGSAVRRCSAPGCVLFFDHTRSRREWCSTACGNRARAARHYARHNRKCPRTDEHSGDPDGTA